MCTGAIKRYTQFGKNVYPCNQALYTDLEKMCTGAIKRYTQIW